MSDRQCLCSIRIEVDGIGDPRYFEMRCALSDRFWSSTPGGKSVRVPHSGLHVHSGTGLPIKEEYAGDPGAKHTTQGSIYAITWRAFQ